MRRRITVTATGASRMVPLDHAQNPFNVTVGVDLVGAATATYTVQYTLDDPKDATAADGTGLVWRDHATLAALTADADGNIFVPVTGVRLSVAAISGTVAMTVLQAGPR